MPSIYHTDCEVLVARGSSRCECCKKHRKTLCAMACHEHKDDVTNPSSHTAYARLYTPEKHERLSRTQKEKQKLSRKVVELECKLAAATMQDGVTLNDELHNDMKKMAASFTKQVYSSYPEGSFQRLFWDQQIKASGYSNSKSMKWHPLFIKWSLYLKHLSGKAYELLLSLVALNCHLNQL